MTVLAVLVAAAWIALLPAVARADGDPASDYLYTGPTYVPVNTPKAAAQELRDVVLAANSAGQPIKVAVIGSSYDLGSITPLWKKPVIYARFLGIELSARFHGVLLVEMPSGFGVYHGGRNVSAEVSALVGAAPGTDPRQMTRAAESAVIKIAAANGHPVSSVVSHPLVKAASGASGHGLGASALMMLLGGAALVVVVWAWSLSRRPLGLRAGVARRLRGWLRWRRPSALLLFGTAVWIVAIVLLIGATRRHFQAEAGALPLTRHSAAVTWPAGAKPAPEFSLRDHNGHPISIRPSRGHTTIIAFLDPVCRKLCPREASILAQAQRRLGPGRRAHIVAVSVDPWGDQRRNLVRDIHDWNVGPDWRWAVGSRAALTRVWDDYHVGVTIKKLRLAGTTVHEIFHDELIYIVDGSGDIRALYSYPFTTADVVRTVTGLEQG